VDTITYLVGLQWRGDRDIDAFVYWWDYILATIRSPPTSETLRDILISKLEHSSVLNEDIAHFHRLPFDDPNRTYEYLRDRLDHFLTRTDLAHNRLNQVRDYNKRQGGDYKQHLATPGQDAKKRERRGGDEAGEQNHNLLLICKTTRRRRGKRNQRRRRAFERFLVSSMLQVKLATKATNVVLATLKFRMK